MASFDTYTLKARVAPVIIVCLPALVLVGAGLVTGEASRRSFVGLGDGEAIDVAQRRFGWIFRDAERPATPPQGYERAGFVGNRGALFRPSDGKGEPMVLASSTPVAWNDNGKATPLDLSLTPTRGGFGIASPAAAITVSAKAAGGVTLNTSGLVLRPSFVSADARGVLAGGAISYANVAQDTDTFVRPDSAGVEVATQLRSPQSPERLTYELGLPPGAVATSSPVGGVRVTRRGQPITEIDPPLTVDAAGVPVPTTMTLEGNRLVIAVPHRSSDVQYPLMVDPWYGWDWHGNPTSTNNSGWASYDESTGRLAAYFSNSTWGNGLYVHMPTPYTWLYPGDQAGWFWTAPGTSWIQRADFSHIYINTWDSYGGKCEYTFLWGSDNQIKSGMPGWCYINGDFGPQIVCQANTCDSVPSPPPAGARGGAAYFIGYVNSEGPPAFFATKVGRADLWLGDDDDPTITATPPPDPALPTSSIQVSANDAGLGIQSISFSAPNQPGWDGATTVQGTNCAGYCDHTRVAAATVGNLEVHTVRLTATDAAGHTVTQDINVSPTVVTDVSPEGQMFDLRGRYTKGTTLLGVFANASTTSGGIQSTALLVDGQQVAQSAADCSAGCPPQFQGDLVIGGPDLAEGAHTSRVSATNTRNQVILSDPWTFYVDHGAPAAVTGLRADFESSRGQAQLSWNPSAGDPALADGSAGSGVTSYEWRRQTASGWTDWRSVDVDEPGFTNAAAGSSVTFQVHAVDDAGNASADVQATVTVGSGPPPTTYTDYDQCDFGPLADGAPWSCYSVDAPAAGASPLAIGGPCQSYTPPANSRPHQELVSDHTWAFSATVVAGVDSYDSLPVRKPEHYIKETARINMDGRNPQIQMRFDSLCGGAFAGVGYRMAITIRAENGDFYWHDETPASHFNDPAESATFNFVSPPARRLNGNGYRYRIGFRWTYNTIWYASPPQFGEALVRSYGLYCSGLRCTFDPLYPGSPGA